MEPRAAKRQRQMGRRPISESGATSFGSIRFSRFLEKSIWGTRWIVVTFCAAVQPFQLLPKHRARCRIVIITWCVLAATFILEARRSYLLAASLTTAASLRCHPCWSAPAAGSHNPTTIANNRDCSARRQHERCPSSWHRIWTAITGRKASNPIRSQ